MVRNRDCTWRPDMTDEEFNEKCVELRGKGYSWRKIAAEFGVGKSTLYEYTATIPEIKASIAKNEKQEIRDNIRSTLVELAIKKQNVVALIYLSKALYKMYDVPPRVGEVPATKAADNAPVYPAMTPEAAKQELTKRLTLVSENS